MCIFNKKLKADMQELERQIDISRQSVCYLKLEIYKLTNPPKYKQGQKIKKYIVLSSALSVYCPNGKYCSTSSTTCILMEKYKYTLFNTETNVIEIVTEPELEEYKLKN